MQRIRIPTHVNFIPASSQERRLAHWQAFSGTAGRFTVARRDRRAAGTSWQTTLPAGTAPSLVRTCTRADWQIRRKSSPLTPPSSSSPVSFELLVSAFGWFPRASPSSWTLALGWRERPVKPARQTMALDSLEKPDSTLLTGAPGSYIRPRLAHSIRFDQTRSDSSNPSTRQTPGQCG